MKFVLLIIVFSILLQSPVLLAKKHWLLQQKAVNGGTTCAACAIIVGLAEQLTQIYNESIADSLARFCKYLPSGFEEACKILITEYGPGIIAIIEKKETPDLACYGIGLCKHDSPQMCHIFPLPTVDTSLAAQRSRVISAIKLAENSRGRPFVFPDLCNEPVIKSICDLIKQFSDDHEPLIDLDKDKFSDVHTFRGTSWRGKDCNDLNAKMYPGRYSTDDAVADTNCNGIYGIDTSTGRTYEEQWCNGTGQMGTVVLGDSVGAHFHIPPEWLTAKDLSIATFADLFFILENEFDWPMLSFTTGYTSDSKWKNDITGPTDSLYRKLRERNRCNHRDFQNIAVNGARSSSMNHTIMRSLSRHQSFDHPVIVILELVGNDVCSAHQDTSHMTTPKEFYDNNHAIFQYLDTVLPPKSVILANGLVDGRVLYNSLHNHIHPIGSTRGDVTYAQLYDYLNCLQVSPCFGWMNSNETWRNITTERAMQLNEALKSLISNTTYKNLKVVYMNKTVEEVFRRWEAEGGKMSDLIEPVDGFHPNQQANALTANVTWEMIEKTYPEIIPPINPFNNLIEKKFKDQGGY